MTTKEIKNTICKYCDSEYKLIYDLAKTSGYFKYCPFCGELIEEQEGEEYNYDN